MHQAQILILYFFFLCFQLFLQLRQLAVLKLSGLIQIVLLLGRSNITVHLLNLFAESRKMGNRILFILPLCLLAGKLVMQLCQIFLQIRQTLLA